MENQTLLSILCITYNHEKFIRQCLDSFVMQKTNFKFKIVIGDDCSTDNTPLIIREYADKYPDLFECILRDKNVGVVENFRNTASKINSKYVAVCEGDDYWTDPYKLQKQVDFLENNPDFSICFHPVNVVFDDNPDCHELFPSPELRFNKDELELSDLIKHNFIQTNSILYRWRFNGADNIYDLFPDNILPCDWFLHLLHSEVGKIKFLDDPMASYRKHGGGIWFNSGNDDFWIRNGISHIAFYVAVERHFHVDYTEKKMSNVFFFIRACLRKKDFEKISQFEESYPELYKKFFESEMEHKETEYRDLLSENTRLDAELNNVYKSLTYKIGRSITLIPGKISDIFLGKKKA